MGFAPIGGAYDRMTLGADMTADPDKLAREAKRRTEPVAVPISRGVGQDGAADTGHGAGPGEAPSLAVLVQIRDFLAKLAGNDESRDRTAPRKGASGETGDEDGRSVP